MSLNPSSAKTKTKKQSKMKNLQACCPKPNNPIREKGKDIKRQYPEDDKHEKGIKLP
jgi:hypothetical protein